MYWQGHLEIKKYHRRTIFSADVVHIRLLIVAKLLDAGLIHHIMPKSKMPEVDEISIVRDDSGPAIPKVTYYCPPKFLAGIPSLLVFAKVIIALKLSLVKRPDMIISYAMYPHGFIAFMVAKLTRRPLIICVISNHEMDAFGTFFPQLYLSILKRTSFITTTGSKTREKLITRGISSDKILILPHAVETDRFYPSGTDKVYDVLYVGRLAEKKHPDTLLKALSRIKKFSKKDITLCIAGTGSPAYEDYLKKIILDLDLTGNVTFPGFIDNTAPLYNQSRMYVLPTEAEGLPFTILEAMACGVPVITTGAGDMTDTVRNSVNALVIDRYDDIAAFSTGIRVLLEDAELYNRIRDNGMEEIFHHHRKEHVMATWREIFTGLKEKG